MAKMPMTKLSKIPAPNIISLSPNIPFFLIKILIRDCDYIPGTLVVPPFLWHMFLSWISWPMGPVPAILAI